MKKEDNLKKMKNVGRSLVADPKKTKVQTSIRIDGDVMLWAQRSAEKIGVDYQAFLNMKLREAMEELSIEERLMRIEFAIFEKIHAADKR